MLDTTLSGLRRQGVTETPEVVLADAGYWHTALMQQIAERGIDVLAPPDGNMRDGKRPGWDREVYAHQPLRERLRGQLMLALDRCDRHAEALAVYQ